MRRTLILGCLGLSACGDPKVAVDAAVIEIDAAPDARAIDAMPDAPPDAAPDAPPDAPSTSPACASGPATLIETSPRIIGNMAVAGNVLYVSAYQFSNPNISDPVVLAIDLVTQQQAAPPLGMVGSTALYPDGAGVLAVDSDGGTIWRLVPGQAPVALVTNRPSLRPATSDGTHLYWSEVAGPPADPDVVRRMALGGGAIELVMTCDSAYDLVVANGTVYCSGFRGLYFAPTTGGTPGAVATDGYPINSMTRAGTNLYFVDGHVYPRLYRVPLPAGPAVLVNQLTNAGRYYGLAVSSDYIYTVEDFTGIRRTHRTDHTVQQIYSSQLVGQDPVLWNNRLYFQESDFQTYGDRYVKYCAN